MKKIIQGKGKSFSSVAREYEDIFKQWLSASGLLESSFYDLLSSGDIKIDVVENSDEVTVSLISGQAYVLGCPFIWNLKSGIKKKDYWCDLLLLLYFMASKVKGTFLESVDNFTIKYKDRTLR